MSTVTKRDLVIRISDSCNMSQQEVAAVVNHLIDEISESLIKGDEVVFRNFGTFQTAVTKPKIGRNPKKPEKAVTIPARRIVKFRPGKELKVKVADTKKSK